MDKAYVHSKSHAHESTHAWTRTNTHQSVCFNNDNYCVRKKMVVHIGLYPFTVLMCFTCVDKSVW